MIDFIKFLFKKQVKLKYNLNTFKIFSAFLVSVLSAFFFTVHAGTYTTGTNISVPIFFNASGGVSAMEFFVSVSGGNLVSLRCGGAGFSNIASGGNKCVVANLGGSANSGTVATATVRGNSPGTLNVSVSGTLSSTSGSKVSGSFSGASHTIIKGNPPAPKPAATIDSGTAPTTQETAAPEIKTEPVLIKTKDGRQSQAKDRSVFGGTINLDNEVTEVVLTKEWDLNENVSFSINSNENVTVDFNALKDPETDKDLAQVYKISKSFSLDRTSNMGGASVAFEQDTNVTSFGQLGEQSGWDGKLRAPKVLDSQRFESTIGVPTYVVDVGAENAVLVFDKPVKVTLPGQANLSVGYSQLGKDTKINSKCIETSSGVFEIGPASECYYFDDNDAVILTKHFTVFYSFYDYSFSNIVQIIRHPSIRNKVIIAGSSLILVLGLGLYTLHKRRKRKNAQI